MKDIRNELSKVLEEYGHYIVYIRADTRFRCSCFVERSGDSVPNCPKCFGTGHIVSIEKIKTRRTISSIPETLVGARKMDGAGKLTPTAYLYFLEHDKAPKAGDFILEVEWVDGTPKGIKEKNEISAIDKQLGKKGRIEFYQVYCRYNPKGVSDEKALSTI